MKILFITDFIPYPILGGAFLRNYNLLRRIALDNQVSLVAFAATAEQMRAVDHMREFCENVEYVEIQSKGAFWDMPGFIKYICRGTPPELRFVHSSLMEQKINDLIARVPYDVIHLDQVYMGLYLETIPFQLRKRTIWSLHDIDYIKLGRIIKLEPKLARKVRLWVNNWLLRYWQPRYASKFSRCITVSGLDRQELHKTSANLKVDVIPNGVDTNVNLPLPYQQGNPTLIFVGNMAYLPCRDAVSYFCEQILPRIKRVIPDVQFFIVGKDPTEDVRKLEGDGIHVTGRVQDVEPYYGLSTACVVPLRAGGGTRLKILEAMAFGRPVVSTSIGCEGLELIDNKHLLIADTPAVFAEKTIRVLTDKAFRDQITLQARKMVVSRYEWDVITKQLVQIYAEVAS